MTTPMLQQYRAIKGQVPDAILFFRLGDFYEMFGDDAEIAAPILEIALTARDAGGGKKIPMCGVPYHAAQNYLVKLVSAGHKVAICEQVEDPRSAKGIVKREIIRIVSPGTLTDYLLSERSNNYIASVYYESEWGLSFLDVSTGEFCIFQTPYLDVLQTELERITPSELLLPSSLLKKRKPWMRYYTSQRENQTYQTMTIESHFPKQKTILKDLSIAAKAAGSLWGYLLEMMPGINPSHIIEIKTYNYDKWMVLDQWTRRNLELTRPIRGEGRKGTLLSILDQTRTAFGARLMRRWVEQPLVSEIDIEKRLNLIEELTSDSFLRGDLIKLLSGIYDLERLMGKISYGNVNAKDMLSLAHTLKVLPEIIDVLSISAADTLKEYIPLLSDLDSLAVLLESAINPEAHSLKEGNIIKTGYSAQVDELRLLSSGAKEWVARLENSERERTGIKSLKIGFNKVFGYYIEVTHANSHLIPENYQRKQTLANAERYVTNELIEYEQKILGAEDKLFELESQLFLEIRENVRNHVKKIMKAAQALAEIDVLVSLAETAVTNHYVRPEIKNHGDLILIEGRHPVVEQVLEQGLFVPNDTQLASNKHLAIITGPNMAGKSTYMRQVALIVLMAHIGSFVPAGRAVIPLVDRIFTRVGASDDLASGQSTFMVEMQEVAYILQNVTSNSLVILDEIGRGTATFDGLSIAWAIAEYFIQKNITAKILFATHYHELTQLEQDFKGVFNLHVAVREHGEEIVFLHKILPGRADRSYGIQVARLAGLPKDLLERAKSILYQLEKSPIDNELKEKENLKQMSMFEFPEPHPIMQEILNLILDDLTPRQALDYLYDLKNRLHVISSET